MSEEYSLAVFEDGSTEMIPKSWIQDYLPPQSGKLKCIFLFPVK